MEENSEEFSNELHQSKISISDAIEGSMFEQWMLELREEIMAIKRLMLLKTEENNTYSVKSKQQESIVPQSENYDEKLPEPIYNGGMRTVFRQLLHEDIFHDLPIYEQEEHKKAPSFLDKHETLRRYSHETYLENASEEVVDETEEILKTSVIEDIPNQDESEANGSDLGFKVEKGISIPREGVLTEISSAEEIQASSEMEACDDDKPDVEINFHSAVTTSREEMGYIDNDNLKFESVADFLQTKEIKPSSFADENRQHEQRKSDKEKAAIHDVETNILQDSGKPLDNAESDMHKSGFSLQGCNHVQEHGNILQTEVCHQPNAIYFGTLQESLNESMSDVGIVMEDEACTEYSVTAGDSKLCANFEGPIAEDNPSTILIEQRFDQDQCISAPNTKNGDRRDPEPKGVQKHSDSHLQGQKSNSKDLLLDTSPTKPNFDLVSHKVNGSENVTHSTIESNAIADLRSKWTSKQAANQKESEVLEQPKIEPVNDKMNLKEKDVGADEGSACGRAGKGILIHSKISRTEDIQASKEMETCVDEELDVEIESNFTLPTSREGTGYVDNGNLELVSEAHFLQTIQTDSSCTADENPQHEKLNAYNEKAAIHDVETNIAQDSGKPLDDAESTIDSNIEQIESTTRDSTIESNVIAHPESEMMSKHTANHKESKDLEQREIEPMNDIMNLNEKDVGADEGSTFGEHNDELTSGSEALLSTRNPTMGNCESRLNFNTESNKSGLEKNQEGTKHISSEDRRENRNKTFAGNFSGEVPATYKASDDEEISLKMSTSYALCNLLADSAYFEKVKNIAESDYSTKPMQDVLPCTRNPVGQEMRQFHELDCVRKQMQEDSGSHKLLLCKERQMSCISYDTASQAKFDKGYCGGNDHFDNICNLCCIPLEREVESKRCKQNNIFEEDERVKAVKEPFKTDNKTVPQSLCDIRNSTEVSCNPCGEDRGDCSITGCSGGTGEMLLQSTGEIHLDMKNTPLHKECVVFANTNYKLAKQSENIIVEAVKEVQWNKESCLREKSISSMKMPHQLSLETRESMQLVPNRTDKKEDIKQDVHTISLFQQYNVNEAKPEQTNTISNRDHGDAFGFEKSVLTFMDKSPLDTSPKAEQQIYRANKHQDDLPSQIQKSAELQLDKVLFHGDKSKYESDNDQNIKVAMKDGNFAKTIWLRTNYTTDRLQVGDENHMVKSLNYKKTCGGCEIEIIDIYNEHRKASVPWLGDGPLDDTLEDVNNTLILLEICNVKTAVFCLCSVLVNRNGIYITEYTNKDTSTSFQKPYIGLEYLDDTVYLDIHGKSTLQLESCLLLQTGCRNKFFLHRSKIMDVSVKRCFLPFGKIHPLHSFSPHGHELMTQADLSMLKSGQFGSRTSRYYLKSNRPFKRLLVGSFYNRAKLHAFDIAQMLRTQTFKVDSFIAKMLDNIVIGRWPMYSLAISTHSSFNHHFSISSFHDDDVDDCRNNVDKEQLVSPALQDKFGFRSRVFCQSLPMLRT